MEMPEIVKSFNLHPELDEAALAAAIKAVKAMPSAALEGDIQTAISTYLFNIGLDKIAQASERSRCASEVEQMDCAHRCGVGAEIAAALRKGGGAAAALGSVEHGSGG